MTSLSRRGTTALTSWWTRTRTAASCCGPTSPLPDHRSGARPRFRRHQSRAGGVDTRPRLRTPHATTGSFHPHPHDALRRAVDAIPVGTGGTCLWGRLRRSWAGRFSRCHTRDPDILVGTTHGIIQRPNGQEHSPLSHRDHPIVRGCLAGGVAPSGLSDEDLTSIGKWTKQGS